MGGRVRRFVKIQDSVADILKQRAFQRRKTGGKRGVMASPDVEAVVVLQEDWPLGGVDCWGEFLGFDREIVGIFVRLLGFLNLFGFLFGFGVFVLLLFLV